MMFSYNQGLYLHKKTEPERERHERLRKQLFFSNPAAARAASIKCKTTPKSKTHIDVITPIVVTRKFSWRIPLIVLFILLVAGTSVALYFFLQSTDYCNIDHEPSEYEITLCQRQNESQTCFFDDSQCTSGCILGYQKNEFSCPISCDCAVTGRFENDISFNPNTIQSILSAYIKEEDNGFDLYFKGNKMLQRYWKQNKLTGKYRIPYVYATDISDDAKYLIGKSIWKLSEISCIDFYLRTKENDFVEFSSSGFGCNSFLGQQGGRQRVTIGKGCESIGLVFHQLLHTLGFWHEQSRHDRDDNVEIYYQNIAKNNFIQFEKRGLTGWVSSEPYEYLSIMHSFGYFFSNNGEPTIVDKNYYSAVESQRSAFTETDIRKLNEIYNCSRPDNSVTELRGRARQELQTPPLGKSGGWAHWSTWQLCSSSCDRGQRARIRECKNSTGALLSRRWCEGEYFEMENCQMQLCSQGLWSAWSSCSVTCGVGIKHRSSCCPPNEQYEEESCSLKICPNLLGNEWGEWVAWSRCSRSCGTGYRQRKRYCYNMFYNLLDVRECPFTVPGSTQYGKCATATCGIKSVTYTIWLPWDSWSDCSTTEGSGVQERRRKCIDCQQQPIVEARKCIGESFVDGSWGEWSPWSKCPIACNVQRRRQRVCYFKFNQVVRRCPGGTDIIGRGYQYKNCSLTNCVTQKKLLFPIATLALHENSTWTQWNSWSECSGTCRGSLVSRARQCLKRGKKFPGCPGDARQTRMCGDRFPLCKFGEHQNLVIPRIQSTSAPVDSNTSTAFVLQTAVLGATLNPPTTSYSMKSPWWSEWLSWNSCPVTCGSSVTTRFRSCLRDQCDGKWIDRRQCPYTSNVSEPCEKTMNFILWKKCVYRYCRHNRYYRVGNFNDDSYGDIVCVEPAEIRVYLGSKTDLPKLFGRTKHSLCGSSYINGSLVGDFNGDGYDDLACPHEGHLAVLHFNAAAAFKGQIPVVYQHVCSPKATVHLGFMDKDLKIDVICSAVPELSLSENIVFNEMLIT